MPSRLGDILQKVNLVWPCKHQTTGEYLVASDRASGQRGCGGCLQQWHRSDSGEAYSNKWVLVAVNRLRPTESQARWAWSERESMDMRYQLSLLCRLDGAVMISSVLTSKPQASRLEGRRGPRLFILEQLPGTANNINNVAHFRLPVASGGAPTSASCCVA